MIQKLMKYTGNKNMLVKTILFIRCYYHIFKKFLYIFAVIFTDFYCEDFTFSAHHLKTGLKATLYNMHMYIKSPFFQAFHQFLLVDDKSHPGLKKLPLCKKITKKKWTVNEIVFLWFFKKIYNFFFSFNS